MVESFKRNFLALALFLALCPGARAFSLLGPFPFNNADAFETSVIGYQLTLQNNNITDNGTPKNLAEGYRWNTRNLYYAFDASFVSYFGSNGIAAVDAAFAVFNNLTNYSAYSADLHEIPQNTLKVNYSAQALDLLDIKSTVMSVIIEEMGLAQPDRYVWTLHERVLPPGAMCPAYNYAVVQRNFDPVSATYSSYVNGTLYGYTILELCGFNPNPLPPIGGETIPYPVDPAAQNVFNSVAAQNLILGGQFFTGLTRDDLGGLRYLYGTNSPDALHLEVMPANTFLVSNTNAVQPLQTSDLAALVQRAQTNSPAQLMAAYPNLLITSSAPYWTNVVTTNVTVYFLNPPLTNALFVTNYVTNVLQYYNYTFGNVVTNHYSPTTLVSIQTPNPSSNAVSLILVTNQNPQILTTSDLGLLVAQAYTNAPAALLALYPQLIIASNTTSFKLQYVTNVTSFYAGSAAAPTLVIATNVTTNILQYYNYVFANVHTNLAHYSLTEALTIETNMVTTSPLSTIFVTNQVPEILSTSNLATLIAQSLTNSPAALLALYPGLQITNTAYAFSNVITTNVIAYYTNGPPWAPVSSNVLYTNATYTTNVMPIYTEAFGNVVTNHYYPRGWVTVAITNIIAPPYGAVGTLATNISFSTSLQPYPNGDYYLLPTNSTLVGYKFVNPQLTNLVESAVQSVFATNAALVAQAAAAGNTLGATFIETYNTYFTNYQYVVFQINGVSTGNLITNTLASTIQIQTVPAFQSVSGDYYLAPTPANPNLVDYNPLVELQSNVVTNDFTITVATNAAGATAGGMNFQVDQLTYFTNHVLVVQPVTSIPNPVQTNLVISSNILISAASGDFFLAPSNTCGYQVLSNLVSGIVTNHNLQTWATNAIAGTNNPINFTSDYVTYFTNYTLAISIPNCLGGVTAIHQPLDKMSFFRSDYDSLLSRVWNPINDAYTLNAVSNSIPVAQLYVRTVTRPDIIFVAQDLVFPGNSGALIDSVLRTAPSFNTTLAANTSLAGPGTIESGGITISLNKGLPVYLNEFNGGVLDDGNGILEFLWGSFDQSTNAPVVYPSTTSLANLQNQLFLQITTSGALTNGTFGVAYSAQLQASGNLAPPYQWSLAPGSAGLPPGLSGLTTTPVSATSINITGVPTLVGIYDFVVQVKDASGRVSQRNLVIEIDPKP